MSTEGWMSKQNILMSQNGILFSLKREDISETCYDIDEPWGYHGKWKGRWKELVTGDNTVYATYMGT